MFEDKNRIYGKELPVNIAVVQVSYKIGEKENTIKKLEEKINEAHSNGARLIVLPELCTSGYVFNTKEEVIEMAENVPRGNTVKKLESISKALDIYLVAGILESDEDKYYNTSILTGPEGYIGKYRKMHLWDEDKLWFEPGDLGIPVFETPIGRIAMIICYDMWFSEMWRIAALKGADIVCVPTNWVKVDSLPDDVQSMAPYMALVAANTNCLFVACADRVGHERGTTFPGLSLIASPTGWFSQGPASTEDEITLHHTCNITDARSYNWNEHNVLFRDRRTDYYDVMLGSDEEKHPF